MTPHDSLAHLLRLLAVLLLLLLSVLIFGPAAAAWLQAIVPERYQRLERLPE